MYGLPCSISFLLELWEVFLFPVFAGAHLRQVLVDSMVDQQKTWGDNSTMNETLTKNSEFKLVPCCLDSSGQ